MDFFLSFSLRSAGMGTGAAVAQATGAGHAAQDPLCSRPDMVSGFASPLEAGCCSAAACSWVAVEESGRTRPPLASSPPKNYFL